MMPEKPRRACARGLWLVAATTLVGALATSTASAQSAGAKAEAEALFEAGRALLASDDYDKACEKFLASERLDPAVGTLMNLAECSKRAGRTATAWAYLREAAALARTRGDAAREAIATRAAA